MSGRPDVFVRRSHRRVLQNKEIMLVLDRNVPPFHVDFSSLRASPTLSRRLSLSGLRRTISRSSTTSGGADHPASPAQASHDADEDKENTGVGGGGVKGFVKKIVEAVKPRRASASEGGGGDGLALTRTRSSHRSQRSVKERIKSHDEGEVKKAEGEARTTEGTSAGGLAFAEPVIERSEGPFPVYKVRATDSFA